MQQPDLKITKSNTSPMRCEYLAIVNLTTPIKEKQIRKLQIGDHITISGTIFTARDEAHTRALRYAKDGYPLPFKTQDGVLYHCGPVVRQVNSTWEIISAGPTTSARLEAVEAEFIENFGIRVVIGKGGMFKRTEEAMKKYGAIYCAFTGGAGVIAASFIKSVEKVIWLDLGIPEAVWILKVDRFGPLIVAIDSNGNNLFSEIDKKIQANKSQLISNL